MWRTHAIGEMTCDVDHFYTTQKLTTILTMNFSLKKNTRLSAKKLCLRDGTEPEEGEEWKITSQKIDTEIWTFINKTNGFYPPETASFSIEKQREIYNNLCENFAVPYPPNVSSKDFEIQSSSAEIPVRQYDCTDAESQAVIIYFHGGACGRRFKQP